MEEGTGFQNISFELQVTLKHKLDIIILYYLHVRPSVRHALCLKVTMIARSE